MKKLALTLAVLALPVMVFAGGGSNSGSANRLRFAWWGNPTRDERTNQMIEIFKQKHPGVTVEAETTGFANYWDVLAAQRASNSLPDVMQMDYAYIEQYATQNLLVNLQPYADNRTIDLSNWSAGGLAGGRVNNVLVALNLGVNAWGLEADTGVLQRAGVTISDTSWTWAEFEAAALRIFQTTQVQTMPVNELYQVVENIVRYYGVPMYAQGGKSLGFTNNAQAVAAVREMIDVQLRLKAAGALYDPEDAFVTGVAMPDTPLAQGRTWNNWNWSNQHTGYSSAANRPLAFLMSPAPSTGMKSPYGTYIKPSMLISMLNAAQNKDLAAQFINFFVNDEDALKINLVERGVPIPTHIQTAITPLLGAPDKEQMDYIAKITPLSSPIDPPDPSLAGEARDSMRPIMLRALLGQVTSEAAVAQMIQAANAVLGR